MTASGFAVGAIAVANAVGSATIGDGPHFWAAPYETGTEFGGLGQPARVPPEALKLRLKGSAPPSTTIALVVTDAAMTKAQAKRLAIMADDGLARAIRPAHAPMDGDTVFAVATLRKPMRDGELRPDRDRPRRRRLRRPRHRARGLRGHRPALPRCAAGVEGPLRR